MAITFFGVATSPADNSGQTGPTLTITPVSLMQDGDLVLVSVRYRASTATITNSVTGGQAWTAEDQYNATNIRARLFWCRFNGTWAEDPQFTVTTGTNAIDAQMLVFRPTSAAYTWSLDAAPATPTYTAPSTPFTVTVTGRDTVAASTVTVAGWHSVDNNTWSTLSGTGWSKTSLGAQYRNTNNSSTWAYNIRTSQGTVANVSQNQATLGGDAGSTLLVTFAETLVSTAPTGVATTSAAGSLAISLPHTGIAGVESTSAVGALNVVAGGEAENATAEPSGVSAALAAGVLALILSPVVGLTGVSATATAGSLAGATVVSGIAGVQSTAAAGDASVGDQPTSLTLDGVEATCAVGTLVLSTTSVIAPTGVGVGAAAATLNPSVSVVSVGAAATATAGTATGIGVAGGVVPVGGVVASTEAGSLAGAITVAGIAGAEATAGVGTVSASGGGILHGAGQPSSVLVPAQVGSLAVLTLAHLQGVVSTVTAEEMLSASVLEEIDGNQGASVAGAVTDQIAIPVGGASAAAAAGSVVVVATSVVAPAGASTIATTGNLAGITAGAGAAAIEGVASSAQAGDAQPHWTTSFTIEAVAAAAAANDVAVNAGDTEGVEVFPAGAQATVQVGALSTGEARAAVDGLSVAAQAGNPSVVAVSTRPGKRPRHRATVGRANRTLVVRKSRRKTVAG